MSTIQIDGPTTFEEDLILGDLSLIPDTPSLFNFEAVNLAEPQVRISATHVISLNGPVPLAGVYRIKVTPLVVPFSGTLTLPTP